MIFIAIINCPECNKEISDKALSCPNCGYILNKNFIVKNKIPGRGFGIAGMVMGILGVIYSLPACFSVISYYLNKPQYVIGDTSLLRSGIVMSIYIAIFGILALAFGFSSRARGYKKGQSTSAIVMGFITLAFCVASVVICIIFN